MRGRGRSVRGQSRDGARSRLRVPRPLRPLCAAAAILWLLAGAAPALASGTLSTQAATNVGIRSVTLNGSSSGWSSGDYCAFLYFNGNSGPTTAPPTGPAVPCGTGATATSYSYVLTGLTPGDTYYYAAAHCASTQTTAAGTFCAPTYQYPYGWDATDPCWTSNAATCPHFTMSLPSGTTLAATSVLGTSATFNATVNVQDEDPSLVSFWFEYSTDPNFTGYSSTSSGALTGTPNGSTYTVSQVATGLTPGTTYYYRVVVASGETDKGPTAGNSVSFTSGGFARTDAATSIGPTAAVINGEVDTGDTALSYSWLYSTSDVTTGGVLSGATSSVAGASVGSGTDQTVSAKLSNLAAGTTYYYQLVTGDPSIHGDVVSFTTLPAYCANTATALSDTQITGTGFLVTGCWSSSGGVYTGYGTVQINGLSFTGPSTGSVTIDTVKGTITTSEPYDVAVGAVRVYSGALSGRIDKDFTTTTSATDGTTSKFDLGATDSGATLYDLPLGGYARMTASSKGGSTVEITALGLPSLFGGVTADGSVTVAEDGTVNGVHAQLGDSTIGPITLPGFTLDGDPTTNTWTGDVNLMFPLAKVGITAQVEVKNGKLNGLGASFSGTDIALDESGLFLAGGGFSTVFSPLTLQGSLDVAFGPKISGYDLMDINAGFYAGFDQNQTLTGLPGVPDGTVLQNVPFTFGIDGTLNLFGFIQLASTDYRYYGVPGWPFVAMHSTLAQPLIASCGADGIGFSPSLTLAGDARGSQFNLVGSGSAALDLCAFKISAGVTGVISSTGLAVCGSFMNNAVGAGLTWPTSFGSLSDLVSGFQLYTSGCSVGPYETQISVARAGARPAAATAIRLPGALPFAVVRVRGGTAPPLLTVHGPHGEIIAMNGLQGPTVARARYLIIPDAANDTTYVELTRPAAGSYSVQAQPGSAPIVGLSVAHGEPGPRVRGRLSRSGARELLRWRAAPQAGQRLIFREVGAGGDRALLTTTRSRGRLSFRPLPGVPGIRSIVVDVYEHGALAKVLHVASFRGPTISRPTAPSRIVAIRRRGRLAVRWARARGSVSRYLILVGTSDGRHRLFMTRVPRFSLRGVPARGKIEVSVSAVNALGVRGPSMSAGLTQLKRKRRHHR